jgi:hypothetical protein
MSVFPWRLGHIERILRWRASKRKATAMATFMRQLVRGLLLLFTAALWSRAGTGVGALANEIGSLVRRLLTGHLHQHRPSRTGCCIDLPPDVYRRADPPISQYHLMSRGLVVTWDNPDIDIFDGANLVTGPLSPDHQYKVRVLTVGRPGKAGTLEQAPAMGYIGEFMRVFDAGYLNDRPGDWLPAHFKPGRNTLRRRYFMGQ